jgi:tetratricopeptide (TPR) repeat protein
MAIALRPPTPQRIALAALLVLSAWTVHASPVVLERARALGDAGRASEAYAWLESHETRLAGDAAFDLAFAIAANRAGHYSRAIIALERVLAVQPGQPRARAEMGRALYAVGDLRGARALLAESRQNGVEGLAAGPIDQLLHAIDRIEADGRSSVRGYLEAGLAADSNLNSAPGFSNVAVPAYGGSLVTIDPAGTRDGGRYAALGGGISGRWVPGPRLSLIGTAAARAHLHAGNDDRFDNFQLDASGGFVSRVERHEYSFVLQGGTYDIDHARVRNHHGLAGEWTYRFDGFRQLNAYVQLTRLAYPQQPIADARRHVVGATYAHQGRGGLWWYGGAYAGEEDARDGAAPHLGHRLAGFRLGWLRRIAPEFEAFVNGGHERRQFGGADPLFLVRRDDRQWNLAAGLTWIPAAGWRISPQVSLARTRSTVALAGYHRAALLVLGRRDF